MKIKQLIKLLQKKDQAIEIQYIILNKQTNNIVSMSIEGRAIDLKEIASIFKKATS